MNIKSYDDYRRIAFDNKTDTCPSCKRKKVKRNPLCSQCRQIIVKKEKKLDEDIKSFCQYKYCPNRFVQFDRKNMKEYRRFVFCRDLCVKEFKKENL
jgi:hypothetical protein